MEASVIICTYNRAESLRKTLQTCCDLVIPQGVTWELLVLDNNSKDHTKQVCESFSDKLPLRYIFEPKQGLSNARNRGIQESTGQLIVFTDDDVDVDPQWLASLHRGLTSHPEASVLGGQILPRWEKPPAGWLAQNAPRLLRGVMMHLTLGETERFLSTGEFFFGANMAFHRRIFADGLAFNPALGRHGTTMTCHEETDLMQRAFAAGHSGYYVPSAIVHHRNPRDRMTERYVCQWYAGYGLSEVRLGKVEDAPRKLFGAPGYLWRRLSVYLRLYLLTRYTCPPSIWLPAETKMAETWGMICEFRRQSKLNITPPPP